MGTRVHKEFYMTEIANLNGFRLADHGKEDDDHNFYYHTLIRLSLTLITVFPVKIYSSSLFLIAGVPWLLIL